MYLRTSLVWGGPGGSYFCLRGVLIVRGGGGRGCYYGGVVCQWSVEGRVVGGGVGVGGLLSSVRFVGGGLVGFFLGVELSLYRSRSYCLLIFWYVLISVHFSSKDSNNFPAVMLESGLYFLCFLFADRVWFFEIAISEDSARLCLVFGL